MSFEHNTASELGLSMQWQGAYLGMSSNREGSSGLTENRDRRYQDRDDPQITQMTQMTEMESLRKGRI